MNAEALKQVPTDIIQMDLIDTQAEVSKLVYDINKRRAFINSLQGELKRRMEKS